MEVAYQEFLRKGEGAAPAVMLLPTWEEYCFDFAYFKQKNMVTNKDRPIRRFTILNE